MLLNFSSDDLKHAESSRKSAGMRLPNLCLDSGYHGDGPINESLGPADPNPGAFVRMWSFACCGVVCETGVGD